MSQAINLDSIHRLKSDHELRNVLTEVIFHREMVAQITPVIDAVYNRVLEGFDFRFDDPRSPDFGQRITNYERLYRTDQDTSAYYQAAREALASEGHLEGINPEHCPKLIAEERMRAVERKAIEMIRGHLGLPEIWNPKHADELLDITLRLMVGGE